MAGEVLAMSENSKDITCRRCGMPEWLHAGVDHAFEWPAGHDPLERHESGMGTRDESEPYLVLDSRPNDLWPGLCVWWRPARCGYCTDIATAGRYSKREAEQIARGRETDHAVPLRLAESLAMSVVDFPKMLRALEHASSGGRCSR